MLLHHRIELTLTTTLLLGAQFQVITSAQTTLATTAAAPAASQQCTIKTYSLVTTPQGFFPCPVTPSNMTVEGSGSRFAFYLI